jgi:formate hydrogenlyase transcriptional activator
LGSTRTSRVNVRIVAATNRDLAALAEQKEFRADLFYRLSVFPISLPPLRERRTDIPGLVRHFVAKFSERMHKNVDQIPEETMQAIVAYDWPGNIRQLQNFVEHGVIVSPGPVFRPVLGQLRGSSTSTSAPQPARAGKTLEDAMREHILETLKETQWVIGGKNGAAARLGLARTTLIAKLRRLGLESDPNSGTGNAAHRAFASAV